MLKATVLFFLMAHILGDFYFQNDSMAKEKDKSYSVQIKHSLIYLIISVIFSIPVFSVNILISIFILSICHWLIDSLKYLLVKKIKKIGQEQKLVFIVDQALHILSIMIISFLFFQAGQFIKPLPFITNIFKIVHVSEYVVFRWTLLLLTIWKPANIIIKNLIAHFKQDSFDNLSVENNRAGAFIGVLERLIILILLSIQQYSAIGLVLTAKSIARYNKISEIKEFAEYYLLGTLLSAAIALISYLLII